MMGINSFISGASRKSDVLLWCYCLSDFKYYSVLKVRWNYRGE